MEQDTHIIIDKELRRDIDAIIQRVKAFTGEVGLPLGRYSEVTVDGATYPRRSRERSLAITKLQEAVMWLGMDLKAINDESGGAENPYPNSKDPSNTTIDATADGLKL